MVAAVSVNRSGCTERNSDEHFRPDVSVVMPCLNEAETLATCIQEAQQAFLDGNINGEVIIADNGSTDGSQQIANKLGAHVVNVTDRGYGSALRGGIKAARGEFIVMADSDASYDFSDTPRFVAKLREGHDLVMGNRFLGGIEPGAMPWKHRYIGNPVLSGIGRLFFRCPAGDFHCGLRGFRKDSIDALALSTTGMEFASEMVIRATLQGLRIAEIPTTLRPDGRSRPPHLRSWRDGWRHLRFMLLYCPRWLFVFSGMLLFVTGMLTMATVALMERVPLGGMSLNVNSSLTAAMVALVGFQLLIVGTFARRFATAIGMHPPSSFLQRVEGGASLELGIALGLAALLCGGGLFASAVLSWQEAGYGQMSSAITVSRVIPAVTLVMVGIQTVFGSFLLSMIGLMPKPPS
ncbi:MAG: glycosyltransferase family 2 protein [Fuerstiella sp.]